MQKPKHFPALKAWYYRNVKFRDQVFTIEFDSYKPSLFENLHTHKGLTMIYLGNKKCIEIPRKRLLSNFNNIPIVEL
jgi:hypothetical protein